MFLFTSTLLCICAAVCECYSGQLTCPYSSYSPEVKTLQRIFCKRDANDHNCCMGMAFQPKETELDQGRVSIKDSENAFTVSVQSLSLGEGVYWCGLRNGTNSIIRLAEGEFFTDQMNFEWSIVRWVLFLLLPLAVILTHIYSSIKKNQGEKRDE